MYDVVIIGGGPAGLSATVGAAAEGLDTLLCVEEIGGQAGHSSRIENYLGFPQGISGPALAERSRRQALKFGATILNCKIVDVERWPDGTFRLTTAHGSIIRSRSVIIASGAQYNRLGEETNYRPFEGKGVHYACTQTTVRRNCKCDEVVVIGGGNSAGQAAMFLSTKAAHVHLLVRRGSLPDTMSNYLLSRIEKTENITIHYRSEVTDIFGDDWLAEVEWKNLDTGERTRRSVSDVYVMIGASPNCAFLNGLVKLDDHNFIETNDFFETNVPGVYAVGDVRSGSVKRVANSVGEGATCIKWLWKFLFPPVGEAA